MKTLSIFLLTFCSLTYAADITVFIEGLESKTGMLRLSLEDEKSYKQENNTSNAIYKAVKLVKGKSMSFIITDINKGEYAISVYHDENNNSELDSNLFGVPSEGYAFSNNVLGSFGAPEFIDAKFLVADENKTLTIKLEY